MDHPIANNPLVEIPYVDATDGGALAVAQAEAGRFQAIIRAGRARYGSLAIGIGDAVSRTWLRRQKGSLADEIDAVADEAGRGGAWLLNLSYEWCCTTGAGPDPSGRGNRMLRTLDWPMHGLGETIVVAKFKGRSLLQCHMAGIRRYCHSDGTGTLFGGDQPATIQEMDPLVLAGLGD
jgi:hypothetical protein